MRINFSHVRTFEEARSRIDMLEEAMRITGKAVKILADLQGPKIRTAKLPASMPLGAGQTIRLVDVQSGGQAAPEVLPFDARGALEDLRAGHRILLDDGKLLLTVIRADDGEVVARVDRGGEIRKERRTGMNLPDTILRHQVPTEDDLISIDIIQRLRLGDRPAVDMVAVSFVESGDDMRRVARALDMPGVALVAKIERPAAVAELLAHYEGRDIGTRVIDDIFAASAAIMIARGDLAVEVGAERVPLLADDLHAMGRHTGVPVGRATQMLESMTTESTPLRAESNDIVDAVQDGAAFVMTSGETAVGNHPVEVVRVMLQHVVTAERAIHTRTRPWD